MPIARSPLGFGRAAFPSRAVSTDFDPYYDGGFALTSGTNFLSRPSESRPASKSTGFADESYIDQHFDTRIYRVTDQDDVAGNPVALRHEYSRRAAWNCDNTLFIAQAVSGSGGEAGFWYLFDGRTFEKIPGGDVSAPGNTSLSGFVGDCEPIWHPTNPRKLWRTSQNGGLAWSEFDVDSLSTTQLFTFSDRLAAISMSSGTRCWFQGEGRPSHDGRYWGLSVQDNSFNQVGLLMYDRQADSIVGSITTTNKPNNVGTSSNGSYCVPSWYNGSGQTIAQCAAAGIGTTDGTRAYTPDFSSFVQLSDLGEHGDVAVDRNGNDVWCAVCFSGSRMNSVGIADGDLYYARMDGGGHTSLYNLYTGGPGWACHVSGVASYQRRGWSCVSHYSADPGSAWFDEAVLAVELRTSGSRRYRLAHHQSQFTAGDSYWSEPHATPSRDFSRVMFGSDFNGTQIEDYMIGLPSWAIPSD